MEFKVFRKGFSHTVLVDDEDSGIALSRTWYLNQKGYVVDSKSQKFHRAVMRYSGPFQIDHRNHNRLDNRKENLRIVTNAANCLNKSAGHSTGISCVSYVKAKGLYKIRVGHPQRFIGYAKSIAEAVARRDLALVSA
jgi:hypothetical protein